MKKLIPLLIAFACVRLSVAAAESPLTGRAAELFRKAQGGRWFADAAKLKPDFVPTSDGQSFLVVWRAVPEPKRWIVSLHGTQGFATDDLALWHPHVKGREVGLVCVQWWLGAGDRTDAYFAPQKLYREIDAALQKLGVQPGSAMLHGFSRGSANSYAVAALDAGRGKRYFSLMVANSGGVGLDYPPTRAIANGAFGTRPLQGTRWITVAGGRDPNPDRDGIAGMRRAGGVAEGTGRDGRDGDRRPAGGTRRVASLLSARAHGAGLVSQADAVRLPRLSGLGPCLPAQRRLAPGW